MSYGAAHSRAWCRSDCTHHDAAHRPQDKYFKRLASYRVNQIAGDALDNPCVHAFDATRCDDSCRDQRITQDIDNLSQEFGTVFSDVVILPLTIAYYTCAD